MLSAEYSSRGAWGCWFDGIITRITCIGYGTGDCLLLLLLLLLMMMVDLADRSAVSTNSRFPRRSARITYRVKYFFSCFVLLLPFSIPNTIGSCEFSTDFDWVIGTQLCKLAAWYVSRECCTFLVYLVYLLIQFSPVKSAFICTYSLYFFSLLLPLTFQVLDKSRLQVSVIWLSLGKLLVNLLQVAKRTNTPLILEQMASSTDHGFFGSWVQLPHPSY